MLDGLKRLFGGASRGAPVPEAWADIADWAATRRYDFRVVGDNGFVIDDRRGRMPWRLEWGPPQRSYIEGPELRVRCALKVGADLHGMVMERPLQQSLEAAVFDQYVEGVQTQIDTETPPEVRWLVMFPKLAGAEMPALRERYIALASSTSWLLRWLDGPLTDALAVQPREALAPVVLMIDRSRLTLRTGMPVAALPAVQSRLRLFECALLAAQHALPKDGGGAPPATVAAADPSD